LSWHPDRSRWTAAELVLECGNGDALAWRELVLRYQGLVFGVARSYGLQVADAEDVFQVTFASLARSLRSLREPEQLEAWLATAARRAALRLKNSERRRARIFSADPAEFEPVSSEQVAERIEQLRMAERVRREIEALGPPCSIVLLGLFESPPRPYRELARISGLAVGSLGATRGRCLDRLRRRLRAEIEGAGPPLIARRRRTR
jgi:RNA polymerase sigma factor (sigma-70 family)